MGTIRKARTSGSTQLLSKMLTSNRRIKNERVSSIAMKELEANDVLLMSMDKVHISEGFRYGTT